jgi:hypothetical protein
MRNPGPMAWQSIALGGCTRGLGNDSVSSTDRWITCWRVLAVPKMKRKLIVFGVVAVVASLGAIYLWGPGTVPVSQQPLVTLSSANASEFEGAFDAHADMPRLVLLLSPT